MLHGQDGVLSHIYPYDPQPRLAARMARRSGQWNRNQPAPEAGPASEGKIARRARRPRCRTEISPRSVSAVVRIITNEMVFLIGDGPTTGRDSRFALSHIQQIAMYVSHVVLQMTLTDVGKGFGRDRTTVAHACARVEDRRDDVGYDKLVSAVERVTAGVFSPIGAGR
jgi:hypothetical protein